MLVPEVRLLTGSTGRFDIGEPPAIAPKLTGTHPVPSVRVFAAAATCLVEAPDVPVPLTSIIASVIPPTPDTEY